MINANLNKFENNIDLGEELARLVCAALEKGIETSGSAVLAVSGGSTPKSFFELLSAKKLPWDHVTITLVDERWVSPDSERSNARLVHENLLINNAANASFLPLFHAADSAAQSIMELENQVAKLKTPFDAVVLGMGSDGHTASFFPGGDNLVEAVGMQTKRMLSYMRAPGAGELRITFTLPVVVNAGFLALHIEGQEKLAVFDNASGEGDANAMPVRHVLNNAPHLQIFWAP